MKRFYVALGKGIVYPLLYLCIQFLFPLVYTSVQATLFLASPEAAGLSAAAAMAQLTHIITGKLMAISLVCSLITIGLYCLTAPMCRRSLREHLWLYPMASQDIVPVLLLGISANLLLSALLEWLPIPAQWMSDYEVSSAWIPQDLTAASFLFVGLAGPVTEELCFRGLLFTRLRQGMPQAAAALISAILFGLAHGNLVWFLYAFPLGLVMVWIFCRFGSVWATMLFHIGFNITGLLIPQESSLILLLLLGFLGTAGCSFWVWKRTENAT